MKQDFIGHRRQDVHSGADLPITLGDQQQQMSESYTESNGDFKSICCALRDYNYGIQDFTEYDCLSRQSKRLRFQAWVAYHRSQSEEILRDERLLCPLTHCRQACANTAALVSHVSTCTSLLEGEYWCPYCQKSERFAPPANIRKRKHMFRDAVELLRNLGSKSIRRVRSSRFHNLQGKGGCSPKPVELQSDPGYQKFYYSYEEENISDRASYTRGVELEGNPLYPQEAKGCSDHHKARDLPELPDVGSTFEMEVTESAAELGCRISSCPSMDWDTMEIPTPELSLSPVSPVSPDQEWVLFRDFESPISPDNVANFTAWPTTSSEECTIAPLVVDPSLNTDYQTSIVLSGKQKCAAPSSALTGTPRGMSLRVDTGFLDHHLSNLRPADTGLEVFTFSSKASGDREYLSQSIDQCISPNRARDGQFLSPSTQIELDNNIREQPQPYTTLIQNLSRFFSVVLKESLRKISFPTTSANIALPIPAIPSAEYVFQNGLSALRDISRDVVPTTFWEIFGLSHLAYACAMVNEDNEEDLFGIFQGLYPDVLKLSEAIANTAERNIFLQYVREIWCPETESPKTAWGDELCHDTASCLPAMPLALGPLPSKVSVDGLRCGAIVSSCMQYLCTLEYAMLRPTHDAARPSRIESLGSSRIPRLLKKEITEKLFQALGLECFHPVVKDCEKLLDSPQPVGLRELELELILGGKKITRNRALYICFTNTVTSLCRNVAFVTDPQSTNRNQYYVHDVDHILRIHRELREEARLRYNNRQTTGRPGVVDTPLLATSTPNTWSPFVATPTSDVSPSTRTPAFFHPWPAPHNTPASMSDLPDLPELADGSPQRPKRRAVAAENESTAEGSIQCPTCAKPITGQVRYLRSNLRRHVREKHEPVKKVKCTVAGCPSTFSRDHNRRVHQETVHGQARSPGSVPF